MGLTSCILHDRLGTPKDKYGVGNHDEIGLDQPHPGIAPLQPGEENDVVYHKYYQWVVFFLFFQATLFYIPRYLNNPTADESIINEHLIKINDIHFHQCFDFY